MSCGGFVVGDNDKKFDNFGEGKCLGRGKKLRVLVSDDGSSELTELVFLLREHGAEVRLCAHDGGAVLSALRYFGAHIVLCDSLTETFGGVELAKKLSIFEREKRPEIMLYTGVHFPFFYKTAHDFGIESIFGKPVNPYEILATITKKYAKNDALKPLTSYEITQTADFFDAQVSDIITDMGVAMRHLGFDLLKRATVLASADTKYLQSITKRLYPTLAAEFDITPSSVERAMRFSIKKAAENETALFTAEFKNEKTPPTNTEFLRHTTDLAKRKTYPSTLKEDILKRIGKKNR